MCIRYSILLGISVALLIIVLLFGGLYVNSNDSVNASLKKTAETGKEIVGDAADSLNEISKSVLEGINDNPESESSGVQNSNSAILLEIPSLNESATDTVPDNPDMVATKMKFGDKQDLGFDMLIYNLKDESFVVSNNSRICPDQNCKFQFKDTNLVYQPNSNDITMKGNLKVDTGEVTKITNFYFDLQRTEAREQNGLKTETVAGTFRIGKEPINDAEFIYNVNGTLESQKGEKTLSLQGVECNGYGIYTDNSKEIDCNY